MSLNRQEEGTRVMSSFDLPTWIANDAQKIKNKPGLNAAHERIVLAGEALDALLIVHAGCRPSLCPTISAYQRVLRNHGYKGEARFGEIGEVQVSMDEFRRRWVPAPTFPAPHPGWCSACGKHIREGDLILTTGVGVRHNDCKE